ncbi:vWA domain-containing protein [Endozoicomonas numazuensis]|uniref:Tellurite resistance protein TerY n=1 Tax=Endozoicomonas numazuensis TaxID=1137799 RepID=A0A081NHG1_9GAMM|nr:VWA domain-containing protein [Endozoicomonas numazuensis]KEQ17884.1 tellurite resistance protein TerY [Endozoicomonas numazuensis]
MKNFAIKKARPLPVIILADTSGSMSINGKIDAMNQALKDLIDTLGGENRLHAEIQLSIITFGGDKAVEHLSLKPAHQITDFTPMEAIGRTPMGDAFAMAQALIEDNERIPSRAYRPFIILISDGYPTDSWQSAFDNLCKSERAQKGTRLAMAIGDDADIKMLEDFNNDLEASVFKANDARDIIHFFRVVSMSVTSRSRSVNPNESVEIDFDTPEEDFLDLDFQP